MISIDPIEMVTLPEPGWLNRGVDRYREGDLDAAEYLFKRLLTYLPEHAAARFMLGLIYVRKGHRDDGIGLMELALERCPWNRHWRSDLAQAYRSVARDQDAVALGRGQRLDCSLGAERRGIAAPPRLPAVRGIHMPKFRITDYWRSLLINCLLCGSAAADGLRDALQATLRNHPAVAGQEAEVDANRHAADAVRSQRYPTLIAQAQQYGDDARSSDGEDLSQPYVLRVRQPIWAFGRIDSSIAVANAQVSTERADLLRVRRQLLEETAVAYAAVRGSQQHIDIARQNVTELEELFEQIQRRVDGQLASSADARLAAARLAEARVQLRARDQRMRRAPATTWRRSRRWRSAPMNRCPPSCSSARLDGPDRKSDRSKRRNRRQARQLGQAETGSRPGQDGVRCRRSICRRTGTTTSPGLDDDSQASVVFEASLDGLGFAARGRTAGSCLQPDGSDAGPRGRQGRSDA